MSDMALITSTIASLKHLHDLAKSVVNIHDERVAAAKSIEIIHAVLNTQEKVLSLQNDMSSANEEISQLKEQIRHFDTWETERHRYELKQFGSGALAYAIKESEQGTEPFHHICAECYTNAKKSILQPDKQIFGERTWLCPSCKTIFNKRG